jgi:hypothetical protein
MYRPAARFGSGVLAGSDVIVRAGDRVLRVALATTLFSSGVKLVDFPGADEFVMTGFGPGAPGGARRGRSHAAKPF